MLITGKQPSGTGVGKHSCGTRERERSEERVCVRARTDKQRKGKEEEE